MGETQKVKGVGLVIFPVRPASLHSAGNVGEHWTQHPTLWSGGKQNYLRPAGAYRTGHGFAVYRQIEPIQHQILGKINHIGSSQGLICEKDGLVCLSNQTTVVSKSKLILIEV